MYRIPASLCFGSRNPRLKTNAEHFRDSGPDLTNRVILNTDSGHFYVQVPGTCWRRHGFRQTAAFKRPSIALIAGLMAAMSRGSSPAK
jgi:hypothetical protein